MEDGRRKGNKRLISDIGKLIRRTSEGRYYHKILVVHAALTGISVRKTSKFFGDAPRTIEKWIQTARESGLEGLRDRKRSGRPSRIPPEIMEELNEELCRPPLQLGYTEKSWNGPLLRIHLRQKYGVKLGLRQCERKLQRLRSSPERKKQSEPSQIAIMDHLRGDKDKDGIRLTQEPKRHGKVDLFPISDDNGWDF
jgi:transposase